MPPVQTVSLCDRLSSGRVLPQMRIRLRSQFAILFLLPLAAFAELFERYYDRNVKFCPEQSRSPGRCGSGRIRFEGRMALPRPERSLGPESGKGAEKGQEPIN